MTHLPHYTLLIPNTQSSSFPNSGIANVRFNKIPSVLIPRSWRSVWMSWWILKKSLLTLGTYIQKAIFSPLLISYMYLFSNALQRSIVGIGNAPSQPIDASWTSWAFEFTRDSRSAGNQDSKGRSRSWDARVSWSDWHARYEAFLDWIEKSQHVSWLNSTIKNTTIPGDRAQSLLLVQLAKAKLYAAKYEVIELGNRAERTHGMSQSISFYKT